MNDKYENLVVTENTFFVAEHMILTDSLNKNSTHIYLILEYDKYIELFNFILENHSNPIQLESSIKPYYDELERLFENKDCQFDLKASLLIYNMINTVLLSILNNKFNKYSVFEASLLEYVKSKQNIPAYSKSGIYKNFINNIGYTPHEYFLNLKMKISVLLLQETKFTVHKISELLEYKSPEYFSRVFKKAHHITPSKYRTLYINFNNPRECSYCKKSHFINLHNPHNRINKFFYYVFAIGKSCSFIDTSLFGNNSRFIVAYVENGEGSIILTNKKYIIKKDYLLLIDFVDLKRICADDLSLFSIKWVMFYSANSYEIINLIKEYNGPVIKPNNNLFSTCINNIFELLKSKDPLFDIKASSYLTEIFITLLVKTGICTNRYNYKHRKCSLELMRQHIECCYKGPFKNSNIIDLQYGTVYLMRIFKEEHGISPKEYHANYKMDKAKSLIQNTNMQIGEISKYLGYSSMSSLCTIFKKHYGMTPKQARNKSKFNSSPTV